MATGLYQSHSQILSCYLQNKSGSGLGMRLTALHYKIVLMRLQVIVSHFKTNHKVVSVLALSLNKHSNLSCLSFSNWSLNAGVTLMYSFYECKTLICVDNVYLLD